MEYQEALKKAIIESFGFFFEDLYNDLKVNIIPTSIIVPMVEVTNALLDKLKEGVSSLNPCAYKMAKQSNDFIMKMNSIYKIYMLNEVRVRWDNKPRMLSIQQVGEEEMSNVKIYTELIKIHNELLPFDLLVDIVSSSAGQRFDRRDIPVFLEVCNEILSEVNCGDCNKYRHFELCEGCEPRLLSDM